MKAISIDFSTRSSGKRGQWLLLTLGTLALYLAADCLFSIQDYVKQLQQDREAVLQSLRSQRRPPQQDKQKLQADALAKEIVEKIQYPWSQAFREVEASRGDGVLLSAFDHAQANSVSKLELQVNEVDRFKEIIERLNEAGGQSYRWQIATVTKSDQSYKVRIFGLPQ